MKTSRRTALGLRPWAMLPASCAPGVSLAACVCRPVAKVSGSTHETCQKPHHQPLERSDTRPSCAAPAQRLRLSLHGHRRVCPPSGSGASPFCGSFAEYDERGMFSTTAVPGPGRVGNSVGFNDRWREAHVVSNSGRSEISGHIRQGIDLHGGRLL